MEIYIISGLVLFLIFIFLINKVIYLDWKLELTLKETRVNNDVIAYMRGEYSTLNKKIGELNESNYHKCINFKRG
jgi:hypothetical protein